MQPAHSAQGEEALPPDTLVNQIDTDETAKSALVVATNDKDMEVSTDNSTGYKLLASDSRRIRKKIDCVILPVIVAIYFLQQLDKSTLSYASVFDLQTDTHLQGSQYSWLGSVVYVAQLVFQVPVAYLLVKFDNARVVFCVVLGWGIVLTCASAATNFGGLMAARFLLGALESAIAPAFLAITQAWYRRDEQTTRIAFWYCTNGVTNMVGSLLVYGVTRIHSPLKKYQLIFLFCGAITVGFSPIIYFFLEGGPKRARLLAKNDDRIIAMERVRTNQMGIGNKCWNYDHVWECVRDFKTWCWFTMILTISIVSGGITTFGPIIVKHFGFEDFETILMNIPFGFIQFCATIGSAIISQRFRIKGPIIAGLCLPPIAGCLILLYVEHNTENRYSLLGGYYLVSFYPAITPLIYAWSSQNTAGNTKQKLNYGLVIIGAAIGNIIGPQLYSEDQAPEYKQGLWCNFALLLVVICLVGFTTLVLHRLNRLHSKIRVTGGGPAEICDESMKTVKEMLIAEEHERSEANLTRRRTQSEELQDRTMIERITVAHKEDKTDLKNEYFTFVY